ncbi:MAG: hypothetical protein Q4G52_03145 [Clostridia bacterium]|nr:hypothetical protein [Clostridia bacterium]
MTVFFIELRRLAAHRLYAALLALVLLYGRHVMHTRIILGIGGTAPFSALSFGTYLLNLLPLLALLAVLLAAQFLSPSARALRALTQAAPYPPARLRAARGLAAACALLFAALASAAYALVFYAITFGRIFFS